MSLDRQLLLLFALLILPAHSGAFFGWFTRKSSSRSPAAPKEANPDPPSLPNAPFEMTTADDKFLAEANQFELSPLDGCHYKVVSHLRSSCTEMSEEEIAKLGVTLFNCQAEVEGRKTYPCTEEMTLAECTASMDPDTWNAYHIVSNRARSVCYATRQLHFRRRTELTVNTLVSTAMSQLEAMKMLKDGQEELKELTSESLQKVLGSQADLLSQQEQLQSNQEEMETSISGNLEMLAEEKALIASGHHLVAQMIEGIAQKMENVSGHLKEQDAEVQEGHKSILADLSEVRDRSQEVYSKIESNLALFLSYQNRSAQYFDVLMEKLQRMNQSLGTVLYAMDHMHRSVENRLSYIQAFINWAGGNLNAIYTCVLHGAYFLLLALMMTFLQTPGFSRAVLLVLIVVNALSELNHQTSLGFRALTALLVCTVIGHWTLLNCIRCLLKVKNRKVCPALPPPQPVPVAGSHTDKGARFSTPEKMGEETLLEKELRKLSDEGYTEDDSLFGHKSLVYDVSIIASPAPLDWKLQHCLRTPNQSTPAMKLRRLSITKAVQGHDSPLKPRSDYPQIRGWIPQLELDRWTLHVCWLMHSVSIPPARGTEKLRDLVHNSPLRYQVGQYNTSQRHLGAAFDAVSEPKNYSLNNSMSSNLSVSSMSPRQFCQAITRAGQPCRNKASGRQEFCRVHASGESSYTAS